MTKQTAVPVTPTVKEQSTLGLLKLMFNTAITATVHGCSMVAHVTKSGDNLGEALEASSEYVRDSSMYNTSINRIELDSKLAQALA